jgi:hypothetical protein
MENQREIYKLKLNKEQNEQNKMGLVLENKETLHYHYYILPWPRQKYRQSN